MKLFNAFAIALLFVATPQSIASSSLAAKDVYGSPTKQVSWLTPSQALKLLALDDETHKKVVDRADPPNVAKLIEIYKLFEKQNVESTITENEETFDRAIYYVPCEIAWHLRILEFGEVIQCLEKSDSWKRTTKIGDQMLVNFFADKHTFELIQLLKTTDVGDKELFSSIQKMISSEGLYRSVAPAFFLQHALALHKQDPTSRERQEMVTNFLSLHLSAIALEFDDQQMLKALYTELAQNVPTLLSGGSYSHAIAVVATLMEENEYDIVIINSGGGIENHESTTEIQPKGFHTGSSYDDVYTSKPIEATSYNPLLRMEEITGAHLSSAHYHSGTIMNEVYYVAKKASSHVVKEPLMPWEWTEKQGIGTCTATSVWFALRFYYQALAYENDLRLSMLDQAIDDLKGFHYGQGPVKDKSEKTLYLGRTIISMALNEILRNMIVWQHEHDINADLLKKSEDEEFVKTVPYSKMTQRCEVLAKAIPQSMASFHAFWKLQEEKYAERQRAVSEEERRKAVSGEEAELSTVLDSWHSIREDIRTMYNDAINVVGIKPAFKTVLEKEAVAIQREPMPIDVESLDEHSSLEQILGYIIKFGDSLKLPEAISKHVEKHTKNANAAKYLIVLYACLMKNVPLLDHLVVQQKLPLHYTIDTTKRDPKEVSMMYLDLETEESIAALAAHEFVQYGQPLDAFPELFTMSKKETQSIINTFKNAYKEIAPIVNAEKPSQSEIDEVFEDFVKQGRVAVIAYILQKLSKPSEKAISDAFTKTDNVGVLRLLIDSVQDSKLIEQKIEASIKKNNVTAVELLLPFYLRYKKRIMEIDVIKKHVFGSYITAEPAEVSFPDHWLGDAYDGNAAEVMKFLAPLSNENTTNRLLLKAAKDGKSEITLVLARLATADAISTAIEEANTHGHTGLAEALFEEYAGKKPVGALFLAAAEQGDLEDLEKKMPSVGVGTIGYALFKAAEKGKMDCFEKLVPHSTEAAISAALSKLPDENLKHPSVLKAVTYARRSVYNEIIKKAIRTSSAELIVRMLPFMSVPEITSFFRTACKDKESSEITKRLFQFTHNLNIDTCLETAVKDKMEDRVTLLLPRVKRRKLVEISQSSEFEKLGKDTQQAIANRIKNFPTEIAIELAFLPKNARDRISLQTELKKYNVALACENQDNCIDMMKSMKLTNSSALIFPIEQAIQRLSWSKEDNAALKKLLPYATPFACTSIVSAFSKHGSEEFTKACAGKALKSAVITAVQSVQEKKNFKLMKFLVPFLSPLGIVELLAPSSSGKIGSDRVNEILSGLPSDLADNALRIAVRGDEKKREKSVPYLLPEASQAAIDEVYLFAKRIKFDDELLEQSASKTAKAQGKEIEGAVSTE